MRRRLEHSRRRRERLSALLGTGAAARSNEPVVCITYTNTTHLGANGACFANEQIKFLIMRSTVCARQDELKNSIWNSYTQALPFVPLTCTHHMFCAFFPPQEALPKEHPADVSGTWQTALQTTATKAKMTKERPPSNWKWPKRSCEIQSQSLQRLKRQSRFFDTESRTRPRVMTTGSRDKRMLKIATTLSSNSLIERRTLLLMVTSHSWLHPFYLRGKMWVSMRTALHRKNLGTQAK